MSRLLLTLAGGAMGRLAGQSSRCENSGGSCADTWLFAWRVARNVGEFWLKRALIVTDGSCIRNPGPGGWACLIRLETHRQELCGSERYTTNNRMELRAAIEGLKTLREPHEVTLFTDSQYVRKGIRFWLRRWKRNGWRTSPARACGAASVRNRDLWEELDRAADRHRIEWEWVKGHADHEENNRCHRVALMAARNQLDTTCVIAALANGLL